MKIKKDFSSMKSEELVILFEKYTLMMDKYLREDEEANNYNRVFFLYAAVKLELKSRPGDERRLLMPFLDHTNLGVRLFTAKSIYAIDPARARHALQQLVDLHYFPHAFEAGMTLYILDSGKGKLE